MKKIKASIMTNKSYPSYKIKNYEMNVNETLTSYYWEYKEVEEMFKTEEDEHPVTLIIEEVL